MHIYHTIFTAINFILPVNLYVCVYAFDFIKEPIKFPLTLERILTTQNHRFSLRYSLSLSLHFPWTMEYMAMGKENPTRDNNLPALSSKQ